MSGRGQTNRANSRGAFLSYGSGYARAGVETRKAVSVPKISNKDAVDCPTCRAPKGEFCIGATGNPTTSAHVARKRMAVRKYYEQQENQNEAAL